MSTGETVAVLFELPQASHMGQIAVRLAVAAVLGGVLGFERQQKGKAAGLRTHMLVALGTALFTVAPSESGLQNFEVSRVIQGIAAGIGFIGAGTILKRADADQVIGLTTAANIWLTAAIGVAVGLGRLWLPVLATIFALIILFFVGYIEKRPNPNSDATTRDK